MGDAWVEEFIPALEKMLSNGYDQDALVVSHPTWAAATASMALAAAYERTLGGPTAVGAPTNARNVTGTAAQPAALSSTAHEIVLLVIGVICVLTAFGCYSRYKCLQAWRMAPSNVCAKARTMSSSWTSDV